MGLVVRVPEDPFPGDHYGCGPTSSRSHPSWDGPLSPSGSEVTLGNDGERKGGSEYDRWDGGRVGAWTRVRVLIFHLTRRLRVQRSEPQRRQTRPIGHPSITTHTPPSTSLPLDSRVCDGPHRPSTLLTGRPLVDLNKDTLPPPDQGRNPSSGSLGLIVPLSHRMDP